MCFINCLLSWCSICSYFPLFFISFSMHIFREWRHYNYKPRTINFASKTESSLGRDVVDGINLHQFSAASVPKVHDKSYFGVANVLCLSLFFSTTWISRISFLLVYCVHLVSFLIKLFHVDAGEIFWAHNIFRIQVLWLDLGFEWCILGNKLAVNFRRFLILQSIIFVPCVRLIRTYIEVLAYLHLNFPAIKVLNMFFMV